MWNRAKHRFRGQHVFITGGSTGIGLALARQFVHEQAHVTLVARTASKLQQALEQLQLEAARTAAVTGSSPVRVGIQTADVTQPQQVQLAQQDAASEA